MDDVIWKLFKETGDIKYYILLRNIKEVFYNANK